MRANEIAGQSAVLLHSICANTLAAWRRPASVTGRDFDAIVTARGGAVKKETSAAPRSSIECDSGIRDVPRRCTSTRKSSDIFIISSRALNVPLARKAFRFVVADCSSGQHQIRVYPYGQSSLSRTPPARRAVTAERFSPSPRATECKVNRFPSFPSSFALSDTDCWSRERRPASSKITSDLLSFSSEAADPGKFCRIDAEKRWRCSLTTR